MSKNKKIHWSEKITNSVGTPASIIIHTFLFIAFLSAPLFGFSLDRAMLILTTIVSLEAIYLSLFIQLSLNRANLAIEHVEDVQEEMIEQIDEISDDIENIEKDIDEIQEDMEEISEDVEELNEEEKINKILQSKVTK